MLRRAAATRQARPAIRPGCGEAPSATAGSSPRLARGYPLVRPSAREYRGRRSGERVASVTSRGPHRAVRGVGRLARRLFRAARSGSRMRSLNRRLWWSRVHWPRNGCTCVRFHLSRFPNWRGIQRLSANVASSRTSWSLRSRPPGARVFLRHRRRPSSWRSPQRALAARSRSVLTWHPAPRRALRVRVASPSRPRNRRARAGTDSGDDDRLRAAGPCVSARSTIRSRKPPRGAHRPPVQTPPLFVPISQRSTSRRAQDAPAWPSASGCGFRPAACIPETSPSSKASSPV